jgi:hypothetical protein
MNPDHEEACDQPGDPKEVAKRKEQNRLAKRRSREKKKQDQVRNEGKAEEEKEQKGGDQFVRTWGIIANQQNNLTSELKMDIATSQNGTGWWLDRRSTSAHQRTGVPKH